jgi:hypothetical protein
VARAFAPNQKNTFSAFPKPRSPSRGVCMKKEAEKHPEIDLIITDRQTRWKAGSGCPEPDTSRRRCSLDKSKGSCRPYRRGHQGHRSENSNDHFRSQCGHRPIHAVYRRRHLAIGRAAGEYAVKVLGGAGNAKGNIVEILVRHGLTTGSRPPRRIRGSRRQRARNQVSPQTDRHRMEGKEGTYDLMQKS